MKLGEILWNPTSFLQKNSASFPPFIKNMILDTWFCKTFIRTSGHKDFRNILARIDLNQSKHGISITENLPYQSCINVRTTQKFKMPTIFYNILLSWYIFILLCNKWYITRQLFLATLTYIRFLKEPVDYLFYTFLKLIKFKFKIGEQIIISSCPILYAVLKVKYFTHSLF